MINLRTLTLAALTAGALLTGGAGTASALVSSANTQYCPRCFFFTATPWSASYSSDDLPNVIFERPVRAEVVEFTEDLAVAVPTPGCLPKGLTTRCDARLHLGLEEGGPYLPEPNAPDRGFWRVLVQSHGGNDRIVLSGDAPWNSFVDAGAGDDVIDAPLRHDAQIRCGDGNDIAYVSTTALVDLGDCEAVYRY